jgi:hypothetical protein
MLSVSVGQTLAKFPHKLGHKWMKLQRSVVVAGVLKVFESLFHCLRADDLKICHVEPRSIASVDRFDNLKVLNLSFGVHVVPAGSSPGSSLRNRCSATRAMRVREECLGSVLITGGEVA